MNTTTPSFRHFRVGDTEAIAKTNSRKFTSEEEASSVANARGQNVYEYDQHGCVGELPNPRNADRKLNP